ncbi:dihydroxyacetone kinase subunit DhaL [Clostridium sp. WILCCON 0269]|uniref:Dihydroxyacetone kinase subunit DhaL n=1 Tax=Candidatus Clostridium eludens TaxID=3381663 RepID=A0ABW8SIP3_9CLOT
MSINVVQVREIINSMATLINENVDYLTELDAAIGDGDHGLNLDKGFTAVKRKLKDKDLSDIGYILKKTGMILVSNTGGASGSLYGTAFIRAGMAVEGKQTVNINDFLKMLEQALAGIKMRGKGRIGGKTMIDAIEPAVNSLRCSISKGLDSVQSLEKAKNAAFKGVNSTKSIICKNGKASYLGNKSIGYPDPGAASSYLILNTIYEEVKKMCETGKS